MKSCNFFLYNRATVYEFKHNKNILPVKGSSHDIIPIVFQNYDTSTEPENALHEIVAFDLVPNSSFNSDQDSQKF